MTQNLDIIRRYDAEYVVILAGDHIYKQDYSRMLLDHVEKGARCTVACLPVPVEEASAFGVMFKQNIIDGRQMESPDYWLEYGNPWEFERHKTRYTVRFGGRVQHGLLFGVRDGRAAGAAR